jgi:hypothetical protein
VLDRGEPIRLVAVARAVGQHEVVAQVERIPGPGDEVVDMLSPDTREAHARHAVRSDFTLPTVCSFHKGMTAMVLPISARRRFHSTRVDVQRDTVPQRDASALL